MQSRYRWLGFVRLLVVGGAITSGNCASAQIVPDRTLTNNSSITTPDNTNIITGGTQAGSNLFHSFEEFSVPNGITAYFNNASDIQNIISRVTGESISDINGLLKANYSANLFLINPNGIIFGPNARLDIGGSFVASTANSINFADGNQFSAKAAQQSVPLLTISVPVGLQYEGNAGNVEVQGSSLQVKPSKSLALLGGNVSMNGGQIVASGGRVELGGSSGTGTVGLSVDSTGNILSLSFPNGVARSDVSFTNKALVNVAGGGGSIAVNAENLEISGQGKLNAGISQNSGSVGAVAGDITVNATGTVTLRESSVMQNTVESGGTGNAGNVNLTAGSLYLISGSQLFTSTFGPGNAGNVNVNVRDTVYFDSGGNGGNINITTQSLSMTNGTQVNAITRGQGNAGNVTINARDTVSIDGERRKSTTRAASAVLTSVDSNEYSGYPGLGPAKGNGGDIKITTGSLSITRGAELNALTKGEGDAGNVTIFARDTVSLDGENSNKGASGVFSSVDANPYTDQPRAIGDGGEIKIETGSLSITRGAGVFTVTAGQGNAGNVTINARNTISLDGLNSKGDGSGVYTSVEETGIGKRGEIIITTGSLSLTNSAVLNANSNGQGTAGNINVGSRSIRLGNRAGILATTTSSDGGNLNLNIRDLLLLRHRSRISTTASTASAGGNGGNISINAPNGFVIAPPNENSDITANAFTGSGGRVRINSFSIFGMEQRRREDLVQQLGTSDASELNPEKLPTWQHYFSRASTDS